MLKTIFSLLFAVMVLVAFAQPKEQVYQKEWKAIDTFLKNKKPKTALPLLQQLYRKAKKANEQAQVLKTVLYYFAITEQTVADNEKENIHYLQQLLADKQEPVTKAVLQQMLANAYAAYYQQHAWQIRHREATNANSNNYTTWDDETFINEVHALLKKVMAQKSLLLSVDGQKLTPVVRIGHQPNLRPSLYHILAFDAITIMQKLLDDKQQVFVEDLLQPSKNFVETDFSTSIKDTAVSFVVQTLQQLLQLSEATVGKAACIDADINRVQIIYQLFDVDWNKVEAAYNQIQAYAGLHEAADQAYYLVAKHLAEDAVQVEDTKKAYRFQKKEAMQQIVARLAAQSIPNYGRTNLLNLKAKLLQKELSATVEQYNLPQAPFRMLVNFKNTKVLYYWIKPYSDNTNQNEDIVVWKALANQSKFSKVTQALPDAEDYEPHSCEVKIDGLPIGKYILWASTDPTGKDSMAPRFTIDMQVTNLVCVRHDKRLYVLDRNTGMPIEKATVKTYANGQAKNKATLIRYTNAAGFVETDWENVTVDVTVYKEKDTIKTNDYRYVYTSNNQTRNKQQVFFSFFTDRKMYRPGQTVYFKVISTQLDTATGLRKVFTPKEPIDVVLKDANQKKIGTVQLLFNAFGSASGQFVLPTNLLTGDFSIHTDYVQEDFSEYITVEEYKRPSFKVDIDPIKETYKLGDTVAIAGTTEAYAGYSAHHSILKYSITKQHIYTYYSRNNNAASIIASGTITTDASGRFVLSFPTAMDKAHTQRVVYDVSIQATDMNGETITANKQITLMPQSLYVVASLPTNVDQKQPKTISLQIKNFDGALVNDSVNVVISALQSPNRHIRPRYWSSPDTFILSKSAYMQYFPNDPFLDETDEAKWPVLEQVYKHTIAADSNGYWQLPELAIGVYKVEFLDKLTQQQLVIGTNYIKVYNSETHQWPQPIYEQNIDASTDNLVNINDTVVNGFYSSLPKIHVIKTLQLHSASSNTGIATFYQSKLVQQKDTTLHIVSPKDYAGFSIGYLFVQHNRLFQQQSIFHVAPPKAALDVQLATYRNKVEPGSKEAWQIKIKPIKANESAELLTSMYDASLDYFTSNKWTFYALNRMTGIVNFPDWQALNMFQETNSEAASAETFDAVEEEPYSQINTNYPPLWWLNPLEHKYLQVGQLSWGGKRKKGEVYFTMADGNTKGNYNLNFMSLSYKADSMALNKTNQNTFPQQVKTIQAPRKNFQETAFFMPQVYADTSGSYTIHFTMPEALTTWCWQSFAHTKSMQFGSHQTNIISQKQWMVQPLLPRFLREGDHIELTAKVVNLTSTEQTGQASIEILDATTNTPVDGLFQNSIPVQYFTVAAAQQALVKFPIQVPFGFNKPIVVKIMAFNPLFSDGEEHALPLLSNRVLLTESLPLYMKSGEQQKTFQLDKLLHNNSESLTHQSATLTYTSNPIWSVVRSMPYLMEYPYECAEQTFNRLWSNIATAKMVQQSSMLQKAIQQYKADTSLLASNLQKNEALKQLLLQETPWVLEADQQSSIQQLLQLLDSNTLQKNIEVLLQKLEQLQLANGAFPWFGEGGANVYITNYILIGLGKLKENNMLTTSQWQRLQPISYKALQYINKHMTNQYASIQSKQLKNYDWMLYMLYMKSFYNNLQTTTADKYFYAYYKQNWNKLNTYEIALLASIMYQNKETVFVMQKLIPAILENTVENTNEGSLYWKNTHTCFQYEAPIEHQSQMIYTLAAINAQEKNPTITHKLIAARTWLLLHKQVNHWGNTVATADACMALLYHNSWTTSNQQVQIKWGKQTVQATNTTLEGYVSQTIPGNKVQPSDAQVTITMAQPTKNNIPSYGALYWQYFEDLNNVTASATSLSVTKKVLVERIINQQKILHEITDTSLIQVGDKLVVQLVVSTDKDMQFIHLKDMRASGTAPQDLLSGYRWQDGLSYYQSTKDASTNFFIDFLPRGTYLLQYSVYASHAGNYSMGLATIQNMYAPAFSSHSQNINITIAAQ